ncbi:L,D-transpeptidase [Actinoplanes sp. NPDC051861]|uniref:L,D-transpeptidase n=1 Tax=Actinoplanes sp. NPDC051861 TaxID=3155170 RepID=UPI003432192C
MFLSNAVGWVAGAVAVAGMAVAVGAVDVSGMVTSAPAPAVSQRAAGKPFAVVASGPRKTATTTVPRSRPVPDWNASGETATRCAGGRRQRAIEQDLTTLGVTGVTVDGTASPAECAEFRAFQKRFGILPARGQADATTADVAHRLVGARLDKCRADGLTACVDLTTQTAWVVRDGKVVFGPTVVRTGFRGHTTPVGVFAISQRAKREWSNPYKVWLPYWQRFEGGNGFHRTTSYLHDKARGSHGCVNLLQGDAEKLWKLLETGTRVHTFGRRPGT